MDPDRDLLTDDAGMGSDSTTRNRNDEDLDEVDLGGLVAIDGPVMISKAQASAIAEDQIDVIMRGRRRVGFQNSQAA